MPKFRYYDKDGLLNFLDKKSNGTRALKDEDFQGLAVASQNSPIVQYSLYFRYSLGV